MVARRWNIGGHQEESIKGWDLTGLLISQSLYLSLNNAQFVDLPCLGQWVFPNFVITNDGLNTKNRAPSPWVRRQFILRAGGIMYVGWVQEGLTKWSFEDEGDYELPEEWTCESNETCVRGLALELFDLNSWFKQKYPKNTRYAIFILHVLSYSKSEG